MTTRNKFRMVLLFIASLGGMVVLWLLSVGNPVEYLTRPVPPGQLLYILSKLTGLLAFALFWVHCMLALGNNSPISFGFPSIRIGFHKYLGLSLAGICLAHLALFFCAAWARSGSPPWDLLLPSLSDGFYKLHLSLGLFAFGLVVVGLFAGWQLIRGNRKWRLIHLAWPISFALAFWHAYAIGSESRTGVMGFVWWFMAASVFMAAASVISARLYHSIRNKARRNGAGDEPATSFAVRR